MNSSKWPCANLYTISHSKDNAAAVKLELQLRSKLEFVS